MTSLLLGCRPVTHSAENSRHTDRAGDPLHPISTGKFRVFQPLSLHSNRSSSYFDLFLSLVSSHGTVNSMTMVFFVDQSMMSDLRLVGTMSGNLLLTLLSTSWFLGFLNERYVSRSYMQFIYKNCSTPLKLGLFTIIFFGLAQPNFGANVWGLVIPLTGSSCVPHFPALRRFFFTPACLKSRPWMLIKLFVSLFYRYHYINY